MQDYKPNSHRFKEEQKNAPAERKFDKVVSGTVKTKKKSSALKFLDVFISDDIHNVKEYFLQDVAVPMIKKGIMGALDMILNGDSGGYYDRRRGDSKVSYRKYYDDPRDSRRSSTSRDEPRARFDFDDIYFPTKGDAEAVLRSMRDALHEFKIVSVGDMYDMADLSQPYTSNKYGWTNLDNAYTERVRGGDYVIRLPKAMPID